MLHNSFQKRFSRKLIDLDNVFNITISRKTPLRTACSWLNSLQVIQGIHVPEPCGPLSAGTLACLVGS